MCACEEFYRHLSPCCRTLARNLRRPRRPPNLNQRLAAGLIPNDPVAWWRSSDSVDVAVFSRPRSRGRNTKWVAKPLRGPPLSDPRSNGKGGSTAAGVLGCRHAQIRPPFGEGRLTARGRGWDKPPAKCPGEICILKSDEILRNGTAWVDGGNPAVPRPLATAPVLSSAPAALPPQKKPSLALHGGGGGGGGGGRAKRC